LPEAALRGKRATRAHALRAIMDNATDRRDQLVS